MHILATLLSAYWWTIPFLLLAAYLRSPPGKGLVGEMLVHLCAGLLLDRKQYFLIRNVTLPTEDGTTQIDHIVVSRFGVFVIETKNYAGWIFGTPQQKTWTQKFPRSSHKFQNPLHQNYKHVRTLSRLLQLDDTVFHSLIVFTGGSTFKTPMPENVTNAGGYIRFIKSKQLEILSAAQVEYVARQVELNRLPRSIKTNRNHVRHVRELVDRKSQSAAPNATGIASGASPMVCPKCGGQLVERTIQTGSKAGESYLGCSAFPACRFVKVSRRDGAGGDQRPVAPPQATALPSAERSQ